MFAISLVVAVSAAGCVMPQHRGVASVVNGALVAGGGALAVTASADEANPNSWHLLDQQASELGAALLLLGVVGEVLTFGLHHDDPDDLRPVALTRDAPLRGGSALTTLHMSVP
jgi:4-amino-4-deoxy-L-arabinose transferase-like glycosyltransferase